MTRPLSLLIAALALSLGTGAVRAEPVVSEGPQGNVVRRQPDPATLLPVTVQENAPLAVSRLPSHGASHTAIATGPGWTLMVGCGHAFQGKNAAKPITIDGPWPEGAAKPTGAARLVAVDYQLDLSIVMWAFGPTPYLAPVAPLGFVPATALLSVGYDEMKTPATRRTATLLGTSGNTTYTREKPWHGRSGGALIDTRTGYLVGVVQGYTVEPNGGKGMYVSLQAIQRFLAAKSPAIPPGQLPLAFAPHAGRAEPAWPAPTPRPVQRQQPRYYQPARPRC